MRAAEMKKRPGFPLMRQTDVQSVTHMQMPCWLFTDPRYAELSLDAKAITDYLNEKLSDEYGINVSGALVIDVELDNTLLEKIKAKEQANPIKYSRGPQIVG